MTTLEKNSDKIFKINNDLNRFIESDDQILKSFQKFKISLSPEKTVYDFFFDENITGNKKLIDIYIERHPDLPDDEKNELNELKNSVYSVFRVDKICKEGFRIYNLVNEKAYDVKSLIKMLNYRGICVGSFLVCRIIPFKGEFFLFSVNNVIRSADCVSAYKLAVSMQLEDSSLLYSDNNAKLAEIEESVSFLSKKYEDFFNNNEIITLNTTINSLLDAFNDYVDDENNKQDYKKFIEEPSSYKYFNPKKTRNPSETYDVGIMFSSDNGLLTIPFYGTFKKIFESQDYKTVKGYKDCVKSFLTDDKVPPFVFEKLYKVFGEDFLQKIRQILNLKKELSFESIICKYKQSFLSKKYFSSPTVLYSSEAFEKLMMLNSDVDKKKTVISGAKGRNKPCPCGSGKKYKKCCM